MVDKENEITAHEVKKAHRAKVRCAFYLGGEHGNIGEDNAFAFTGAIGTLGGIWEFDETL